MPELITPFCTKAWADAFFAEYVFDSVWNDASDEKKQSALKAATDFIELYCEFYDENDNPFFYEHSVGDDFEDKISPRRLKQACAQEAAYLLSLDDNPAEPHPLTILGLLRGDFGVVDPSLVPPIFSRQVAKLLSSLGGIIEAGTVVANEFACSEKKTTN